MEEPFEPRRGWAKKFAIAFRGIRLGAWGQSSFAIHVVAAVAVLAAGSYFHVSYMEWCLLTLCVAAVIAAELFNSSLEAIAKAITNEHNENVRDALDVSSGAVLVVAIGAAIVGLIIFLPHIMGLVVHSPTP